ncbi:MAG: GntR family transcriptional regulator [Formivibrio sp.]|nr:GntR family transcriptional regulator [Formivibrio sp.]
MAKLAAQPLYQQVRKEVLVAIKGGEWQADDSLPSENDLARRFGVSQGTVRKALDALVTEDVLYRRQGVGTFVAGVRDDVLCARFVPLAESGGSNATVEFISCVRIHAGEVFADMLGLRRGATLWQVRRMLRVGGDAVGVEEMLLPESFSPEMETRRIRELKGNLRELIWRSHGARLVDDPVRYRAVPAAITEARLLHVELNEPLLQISRLSRDYEGQPQLWSVAWLKTDRLSYEPQT